MRTAGVLILLALAAPARAATVRLTLDQACELARRQNPTIERARRTLDEADARIKQARAVFYPQIGFSGIAKIGLSGATNGLGLVGLPNSPFYRNLADSLNVSQNVVDFGRSRHQVDFERRRREAREAEMAAIEGAVLVEVERAYFGLLRARGRRDAAAETLRSRESAVRQAQAFYEGQIRSRVDVDLAEAARARAHLDLFRAEAGVGRASAALARVLGSAETDFDLEPPDLTAPKIAAVEDLLEEAYRLRPELRAVQAERAAAAENLRLARSQLHPSLSMVFSGGYARFANVLARQLLAAGAGLVLPVYTGGRLRGQMEEAQAALRAIESREVEMRQQVAFEVRTASLTLRTAVDAVASVRAQSEFAGRALRLATERYRERLGTIVELEQAQSARAHAADAEAAALYDVKIAEAELRLAVGRPRA